MYTRRCITEEHDYGVCESDQLQYLDKECSGKQECEVDVSSKDMMDTTDCSEILRLFLEASYNCQNGKIDYAGDIFWIFVFYRSYNMSW